MNSDAITPRGVRRCYHTKSCALQPSCREPPLPVTARTCTPRKLPPRHRPAAALPMRTCHPSNIGGSGMRAHLRRRLKTRSPLKIQPRLQRPRLPRFCCEKARFRWQVFSGHLWDHIEWRGLVAGGYIGELGGEKCSCSGSRISDRFGGCIKQNSPFRFAMYRSNSVAK